MADIDLSVLAWRKSSASFESDCVEVAACLGLVIVRDTRGTAGIALSFPGRDWDIFLRQVRDNVSCKGHAPSQRQSVTVMPRVMGQLGER